MKDNCIEKELQGEFFSESKSNDVFETSINIKVRGWELLMVVLHGDYFVVMNESLAKCLKYKSVVSFQQAFRQACRTVNKLSKDDYETKQGMLYVKLSAFIAFGDTMELVKKENLKDLIVTFKAMMGDLINRIQIVLNGGKYESERK